MTEKDRQIDKWVFHDLLDVPRPINLHQILKVLYPFIHPDAEAAFVMVSGGFVWYNFIGPDEQHHLSIVVTEEGELHGMEGWRWPERRSLGSIFASDQKPLGSLWEQQKRILERNKQIVQAQLKAKAAGAPDRYIAGILKGLED